MRPTTEVQRLPFFAQPWEAGLTGWLVVFGAVLVELVAGIVTNHLSISVAAPILITPAAIAVILGLVQWLQVRSVRVDPAPWWHLTGIGVALLAWVFWPITPSALQAVSNAHDACVMMYTATPACVAQATAAMHDSSLTWWITGIVILAMAPLVRGSRIAAWAAVPVAFAGCLLASHYLELLLLHYHVTGG